jgi:hypothetical protein
MSRIAAEESQAGSLSVRQTATKNAIRGEEGTDSATERARDSEALAEVGVVFCGVAGAGARVVRVESEAPIAGEGLPRPKSRGQAAR